MRPLIFRTLVALLLFGVPLSASAASVKLAWDPVGEPDVAGYVVRYGTSSRAYSGTLNVGLQTTATVNGLVTGVRYYFTVQAYTSGGTHSDYSLEVSTIADDPAPIPARITSPAAGGTLAGSTVTFQWGGGFGVDDYWLDIGSARGGYDLLSAYQGRSLGQTVSGLPIQGQRVWVRLYSRIRGQWQFVDHQYQAASLLTPGRITSPAAGTQLTGTAVTFTWSTGSGVESYWLDIGTTQGGYDILSRHQGTATSATVSGLPSDGLPVWVRLYSRIGTGWQFTDHMVLAASPRRARLVLPASGSFVTSSLRLQWLAGSGDYWLDVGTVRGGYELYSRYQGHALSTTVTGVPESGRPVWVRLYTRINGEWQYDDYSFATAPAGAAYARIVTPSSGDVLSNGVAIEWLPGKAAAYYWLDIGTSRGGYDIMSKYQGTGTTATVTGLHDLDPATELIWVRLHSRVGGAWQFVDYSFSVGR